MSRRIETGLLFLARFRSVRIDAIGFVPQPFPGDLAWAVARVNDDGTEEQTVYVMERGREVRTIWNLSSVTHVEFTRNPHEFWEAATTVVTS